MPFLLCVGGIAAGLLTCFILCSETIIVAEVITAVTTLVVVSCGGSGRLFCVLFVFVVCCSTMFKLFSSLSLASVVWILCVISRGFNRNQIHLRQ